MSAHSPSTRLLAGVAEAIVTPPVGIPILGPEAPSTGVHDDLFARVLVLDDGEQRVALVCLDLIGLDFSLADELRHAVSRRTGAALTLLNCSHTHSAPFTIPWSVQGWEDFERNWRPWRDRVKETVAATAARAAASLREATLRVGRAPAQVGMNRRVPRDGGVAMGPNAEGAVVPWVDVLRVDGADGAPLAVLFSHAAHPVIVHAASTLIGADFAGYATAAVREQLGGAALFAQGCGGNINGDPLRGGLEEAERAGNALAGAVLKAAADAEPAAASELTVISEKLALPFQDWPPREECERVLQEAESCLTRAENDPTVPPKQRWGAREAVLCLRDLLAREERGAPKPLRFEIGAVAVGDRWCLLAMTHEVFAEYQLWIEQASPSARTMVWAYTNGCESYIATDAALALGPSGGYEAASFPAHGAAMMYSNRVALRPGIEGQIRGAIERLLARME